MFGDERNFFVYVSHQQIQNSTEKHAPSDNYYNKDDTSSFPTLLKLIIHQTETGVHQLTKIKIRKTWN